MEDEIITIRDHKVIIFEPGHLRTRYSHNLAGEAHWEAQLNPTLPEAHGEVWCHAGGTVQTGDCQQIAVREFRLAK